MRKSLILPTHFSFAFEQSPTEMEFFFFGKNFDEKVRKEDVVASVTLIFGTEVVVCFLPFPTILIVPSFSNRTTMMSTIQKSPAQEDGIP